MKKGKLFAGLAMLAALFTGNAKAMDDMSTAKKDTATTVMNVKPVLTMAEIARKVGGRLVTTHGGACPTNRLNQKQYRKLNRQNPCLKRSKKHRSKN